MGDIPSSPNRPMSSNSRSSSNSRVRSIGSGDQVLRSDTGASSQRDGSNNGESSPSPSDISDSPQPSPNPSGASENDHSDSENSSASFDFDSQFASRAANMNDKYRLNELVFGGGGGNRGAPTTRFDCLLLVLCYAMRHGLSDVAIEDLLKLINCLLFGEPAHVAGIPDTLHTFHRVFEFDSGLQYHFYCPKCGSYIGKKTDFPKESKVVPCPVELCRNLCNVSNLDEQNYFVILPLKYQLQCFLESQVDATELLSYRFNREQSDDTVRDVFDGLVYKQLSKEGEILSDVNNFSLTVNADGSPVFVSNSKSMWPIQCRINEVPPDKRFNAENTFLAGLWFGENHPNMNLFLSKFVLEAQELETDGMEWCKPGGDRVKSKVVVINSVFDSVAKPDAQGMMQFNAYEACGYCFHPGDLVDLTNNILVQAANVPTEPNDDEILCGDDEQRETVDVGAEEPDLQRPSKIVKQVRYAHRADVCERTDAEMRADMIESVATKRVVRGVKCMCPFIVLSFFNLVFGFLIDYMHCALLGVTKQMLSLWLDTKFRNAGFSIRGKIEEINQRLLNLKPPVNISRRPQSVKKFSRWKANEMRAWLLYYCLPCLKGILPDLYLKHLALLVTSIYILSSDKITLSDLDVAQDYLKQFVADFETLYGPAQMVYNVHLLTHLTQCVRYWGPLWTSSAFCFETGNGRLLGLVQGTRGVVSQIVRKYCMYRFLPKAASFYEVSDGVADYCNDLLLPRKRSRNVEKANQITLFESSFAQLTQELREFLATSPVPCNAPCFHRFIFKGAVYYSKTYNRRKEKSIDFVILLKDQSYGVIERCVVNNDIVYLVVRTLKLAANTFVVTYGTCRAPHIKVCDIYPFGDLKLVKATEISSKCLFLKTSRAHSYVTVPPNHYEKD